MVYCVCVKEKINNEIHFHLFQNKIKIKIKMKTCLLSGPQAGRTTGGKIFLQVLVVRRLVSAFDSFSAAEDQQNRKWPSSTCALPVSSNRICTVIVKIKF
jgi:hypothetical protein